MITVIINEHVQDPNARNCHGYRKFVRRSTLENPANGYLLNDTIVIRYTIELVVSSGGALTRAGHPVPRAPSVQVNTLINFLTCRVVPDLPHQDKVGQQWTK
jgi:hypothetical protein